MPEIKIKHVVSFSSEDKVHKADNLIKPETYRKWKCATPGEKTATVVLQFEKATQISSIDIGNECSAFIEVLVGRSSDTVNDYQVLLVASSFMSPLESRTSTHTNRVRMFGPEKLSQSTKDEKWDCVQVVCTQPFNKNITYGLSFIKFHSPPEKTEVQSKNSEAVTAKIGPFKLKSDDEDDSLLSVGSWFEKQRTQVSENPSTSTVNKTEPSYASVLLASTSSTTKMSPKNNTQKRKVDETDNSPDEPPIKKAPAALNREHIVYKDILGDTPESKKVPEITGDLKKNVSSPKPLENKHTPATPPLKLPSKKKEPETNGNLKKDTPTRKPLENRRTPAATPVNKPAALNKRVPFEKIMDKVVFVLSGFVNPLRSELRDKALEMGAKYKGDWDNSCTHLVCAFLNTPKCQQVKQLKGRIVTKEWILDCYKKKKHIPWNRYMLGKSSKHSSEDSDDSEEYVDNEEESDDSDEEYVSDESEEEYADKKKRKKKKNNAKAAKSKPADTKKKDQTKAANNKTTLRTPDKNHESSASSKTISSVLGTKNHSDDSTKRNIPSTSNEGNVSMNSRSPSLPTTADESETEDEEAIRDYLADTDVEDDSGGDTEDEIRKVEMEIQNNKGSPSKKVKLPKESCELSEKPDITDLPLPELPNLFKQKHFFLFGEFSPSKWHDMHRFIVAYNGVIEDYMSDKIKYVITEAKWDTNFEDALSANEDLIFVKPAWIYKCHEAGKLVPFQPYIIIPDS